MFYGVGSIYDPATYPEGVPNPLGPRVHAWGEGPTPSEGTRYHGPIYTRPMWGRPYNWQQRPLNGLGAVGTPGLGGMLELGLGILGVFIGLHMVQKNLQDTWQDKVGGAVAGALIFGAAGRWIGSQLEQV